MSDALKAKIAERRAYLSSLDEKRVVAAAELRAYEDALRLIGLVAVVGMASATVPASLKATGVVTPSRFNQWPLLLTELATRHPASFDIDEIDKTAAKLSFRPTRGNIRSQMAAFVNKRILERLGKGTFKFTDEGVAQFAHRGQPSGFFPVDGTTERPGETKSAPSKEGAEPVSSDESAAFDGESTQVGT